MANRLEPINVVDFTGGLNLRRNQFQLADNESPDMLNMDIDPRGGFITRRGWQRWNATDAIDPLAIAWEPRNAFAQQYANGSQDIYVANQNNRVYYAGPDAIFHLLGAFNVQATPHRADFASWGDDIYMACGMFNPSRKVSSTHVVTVLDPDNWSEVDAPLSGVMPQAEYVEAHGQYLFVAVTVEDGTNHFGRLRWSHPQDPDSWREDDFLDIDVGGGRITNLMSFDDHLLIFKSTSIWALYGYDGDSWQLRRLPGNCGAIGPHSVTKSERAVYFFSPSDRGGIYGYAGSQPVYMSEALRPAFEEILNYDNVFVSWAGRRLWVGVPWIKDIGSTVNPTTTFVYDPDTSEGGAWTMYRSDFGAIGPVIDGSDVNAKFPLAAFWSLTDAIMVTLDFIDGGYDILLKATVLAAGTGDLIVTGVGDQIEITGGTFVGDRFDSYYRTRWLHGGWPDRKKSWRRPTFICRQVPADTDLIVETYRDYNETQVSRTRTLKLQAVGNAYWTEFGASGPDAGGFDWTEGGSADPGGADWGSAQRGSTMQRAGSQGLARAVQVRVRPSPTTPLRKWGVDGIVAKIVMRRFR